MHRMRVMSPAHGDYEVKWDPEDEGSIATAREQFDSLRQKGMMAYTGGTTGNRLLQEFDPAAEEVVVTPRVVGG